ncbi:MAG: hypothetical protein ACK5LC_09470 [Coprobacillaceae bacterium]
MNKIMDINLPSHYYFSYEKTCPTMKQKEITIGKDSLGNVYCRKEEMEYLFMKYGQGYTVYQPDSYRVFKKISNRLFSLNKVEQLIEEYKRIIFSSILNKSHILKYKGKKDIGGRECSIYTNRNTNTMDVLVVDKHTGVFREWVNTYERVLNKRFILNEMRFRDMFIVA